MFDSVYEQLSIIRLILFVIDLIEMLRTKKMKSLWLSMAIV